MSAGPMSPAESIRHELHTLRDQWWCFLILGIALVVLGTIAIGSPIVGHRAISRVVRLPAAGRRHHASHQLVLGRQVERHAGPLVDRRAVQRRRLHDHRRAAGKRGADRPADHRIFLIVSGIFRIVFALIERFHGLGLGAAQRRRDAAVGRDDLQAMARRRACGSSACSSASK